MADTSAQLADALRDRYVLERELGRGGMATVYLARDLKHDRPVALKVLRPELAATVGPERFRREIQLAARLQHPHILTVHDSGEANGELWFTMPYVEGENLRARLGREGQLPLETALRITREAAQALQYAHEHGVVHRDIKPENLLLTPDGNTLVADFGIARAIGGAAGAQERLTETGLSIGTPRYMSPEQASGDRAVDARADVYSLGCVLYEMLAGHPPFHGTTAQEILARHALDPVPPLRSARDAIPPAIEQTVARALAKSPADRFPTAARFAEALAIPEQTLPVRPTVSPPTRRVPGLAVAAVSAGLIALAAAYVWWPRPVVKLDPDLVAVLPFRVSGAAPTLDYLREGMIDLSAAKLSGEAGARAADPRSVISAWRHVAGSHQDDLSERASLELARRLGAGQLLLGGVVGTPTHLVLDASLLAVRDGKTLTKATVEGAADSLPVLVDRLLAQLIAGKTGVERGRTGLVNTPLPALRAYLEGQAAYRRGDYGEAVAHFDRALELDSTFAVAGLALASAAGWANAPGAARRGLEHAWAGRDRLSPRDRALLVAEAGPRYPVPSSLAEYLAAWEKAVDLAPDQPDRWHELGDVYFHDGPYLRIAGSEQRAAEAFRRSIALDSAVAPLGHLLEIALMRGDSAGVRRLGTEYLARDSAGELGDFFRWRIAEGLGDTVALRRLRERSGQMTLSSLWRIMNHAALDGTHLDDADAAAVAIRAKAGSGSEWQRSRLYLHAFELNRGRPGAALADTADENDPDYGAHAALYQRVLDALYGDGDSVSGARAARELIAAAARAPAGEAAERASHYSDLCVGELWRLEHGDAGTASRTIARLRGAAPPADLPASLAINSVCAAILDAMLAAATHRSDAAAMLEHLDSIMRAGPGGLRNGPAIAFTLSPGFIRATVGITPVGFEDFANLIVARLYERVGNPRAALEAVRRRAYAYHRTEYLSNHLRQEARLAALTGDRPGAVRAWQHYLALRSDPEPALRGDAERARAELAKLGASP